MLFSLKLIKKEKAKKTNLSEMQSKKRETMKKEFLSPSLSFKRPLGSSSRKEDSMLATKGRKGTKEKNGLLCSASLSEASSRERKVREGIDFFSLSSKREKNRSPESLLVSFFSFFLFRKPSQKKRKSKKKIS